MAGIIPLSMNPRSEDLDQTTKRTFDPSAVPESLRDDPRDAEKLAHLRRQMRDQVAEDAEERLRRR